MEVAGNSNYCYPTSDEIDPQQALFLFEKHCAILIIESLPTGSEFGIDLLSDRVGEKFKGIKLIPPGIHFIYASPVDKKSLQCGPRSGFFYNFQHREILIKKWSVTEEDFDDSHQPTLEQIESYKSNLRELDRYLSPYRFSTYKDYSALTNELTPQSITSLHPECNRIRSVPYYIRGNTNYDTAQPKRRLKLHSDLVEQNLLQDLQPDPKTVIHFSNLQVDMQSTSVVPNDVTTYNLDSTTRLEEIFPTDEDRIRLLQEFQFAFITFLLCHVYECFEHWKRILSLVCKADSGLRKYPKFYLRFITTLKQQLQHVPEDIFEDIVDSRNLIRTMLDFFFQNIEELEYVEPRHELRSLAYDLKAFIHKKFKWHFDIEPEDEQPVVVELA